MTAAHVVPARVEDWQPVPTEVAQPWLSGALPVVLTRDAHGREWTDEGIRRYWRRTARTRMRRAFTEHGYGGSVADVVALGMQRALRGYHGPDEPPSDPVPFFDLAYDGCEEGFMQAWNCPVDPQDPAEDDMPTWASQHAEYERTGRVAALALFTDSLNRPEGT